MDECLQQIGTNNSLTGTHLKGRVLFWAVAHAGLLIDVTLGCLLLAGLIEVLMLRLVVVS